MINALVSPIKSHAHAALTPLNNKLSFAHTKAVSKPPMFPASSGSYAMLGNNPSFHLFGSSRPTSPSPSDITSSSSRSRRTSSTRALPRANTFPPMGRRAQSRSSRTSSSSGSYNSSPGQSSDSPRVSVAQMARVRTVQTPSGAKASQTIAGSSRNIGVIGRDMRQVVDFAKALQIQGWNTKLFAGKSISQTARDEFAQAVQHNGGQRLSYEQVKKTRMYKDNVSWMHNMLKSHATIVDVGNSGNRSPSAFYNGERKNLANSSRVDPYCFDYAPGSGSRK